MIGLSKMIDNSLSSLISIAKKSSRNINLSTFTINYLAIPYGWFMEFHPKCSVISICFISRSPVPSVSKSGKRLKFKPKSTNDILMSKLLMVTEKLTRT